MYYLYRQNNSRGYFKPPAIHVFVEAENQEQANKIFLSLNGCYFDPDCHFDCECCGPRWSESYLEALTLEEVHARIRQQNETTVPLKRDGIPTAYIRHRHKTEIIL